MLAEVPAGDNAIVEGQVKKRHDNSMRVEVQTEVIPYN